MTSTISDYYAEFAHGGAMCPFIFLQHSISSLVVSDSHAATASPSFPVLLTQRQLTSKKGLCL